MNEVKVEQFDLAPPSEEARTLTESYGTHQFCKARALPMRSFKEAMQATPT